MSQSAYLFVQFLLGVEAWRHPEKRSTPAMQPQPSDMSIFSLDTFSCNCLLQNYADVLFRWNCFQQDEIMIFNLYQYFKPLKEHTECVYIIKQIYSGCFSQQLSCVLNQALEPPQAEITSSRWSLFTRCHYNQESHQCQPELSKQASGFSDGNCFLCLSVSKVHKARKSEHLVNIGFTLT